MGFYGGWAPYVSVAERRKKAEKEAAKAKKSGINLSPIEPYRGAIAKTFWGKAWCDNLEAYSDYANRMPRGRTYVRNGSVIDLKITEGEIQAQVMGSSLYKVNIKVTAVPAIQWQAIGKDCSGSIDSLVELLQGKLSTAVMQRICTPRTGLFPAPKEISFRCSCPDSASMCKHIAAALYGVGARLDQRPELLFALRGVDAKDLVSQAGAGLPKSTTGVAVDKVLDDSMLADVFGIEMDEEAVPAKSVNSRKSAVPEKKTSNKVVVKGVKRTEEKAQTPARKTIAVKKVAAKKAVDAKPTSMKPASLPKSTVSKTTNTKSQELAKNNAPKKATHAKKAATVKSVAAAIEAVDAKPAPIKSANLAKSTASKTASAKSKVQADKTKPQANKAANVPKVTSGDKTAPRNDVAKSDKAAAHLAKRQK